MTFNRAFFALTLSAALTASFVSLAVAAEGQEAPPREKWSFAGVLGKFDRAQLQRGFKVYREVCQNCHGLNLLSFRNLAEAGGPGFSPAQAAAVAAEYKIKDGPNDAGDMFERAGRVADRFPSPFPNENAARASNGGAFPPDRR
jgi:cytochrome c1